MLPNKHQYIHTHRQIDRQIDRLKVRSLRINKIASQNPKLRE